MLNIVKMSHYHIHPTAIVDAPSDIGEGTHIWHFTHIREHTRIGKHCNIGQNVYIDTRVTIGNHVKIQNNVSLYNGIVCEDDVFIGPSAVFTNVTNPRAIVERKDEFRQTLIRKGATVGANATIICGNEIGEYAFVGGGSVVTKNVKPYALVVGNPARQVGWVSENGQKLHFDKNGEAICPATGEKYVLENDFLSKK
ncbi:MAG: acyltransferase [Chitinophagaceae bacterium]